jgi:hypothetical protein
VSTAVEKHPPVDVAAAADNDHQLWSVTTILSALDRPALTYWACEKTAVAAVTKHRTWQGMLADDHPDCDHTDAQTCAAVKWLRDARWRKDPGEKSDTETGTEVHAACEQYVLEGVRPDVPPDIDPYLRQFEEWCQRAQPAYTAAEVTVYHPTYGYAGTADAFLTVGGVPVIADYKTSRKPFDSRGQRKTPYPEVSLQLAAYANAEFAAAWRPRRYEKWRRRYYLLSDHERTNAVPLPDVDAGLAILITPEFCDAWIVDVSERVHEAFLFVLEAHRWQTETSRVVIAPDPLEVT